MNTNAKDLFGKVKGFFKNMSMKMRVILCVVLVAALALIAALYIRAANQPYITLFNGLSETEKSSIISYMEENAYTDYRIEGDSILVRAEQQDALLARLLVAGYPKSGSIYEFYTSNVGTLTTNSERDTYWLIARAQKMEATLRCMEGITDAQVQIDLGKDPVYALDDPSTEPTVSVTLTLQDGYTLSSKMATAVRHLVTGALSGLKDENVKILDTLGNTYGDSELTRVNDNSQLKLQLQEYYNNMVRTQVVQALGGIYGRDNVRVAVSTAVNVDRRVVESKEYTQPEGSYENGGLIGKENVLWVITPDGVDAVGGVPGTSTNADIPLYLEDAIQGAGDNAYAQYWSERENKLNENSEQVEVASFTITDIQVAVTINENANTAANVNEEALREHVATASGIGGNNPETRVSILIAPFYTDPLDPAPTGFLTDDIMPFIIAGAALLLIMLILLITLLSVKRKRKKQRQAEMEAIEEELRQYGPIAAMGGEVDRFIGPDGQPVQGQVDTKANITEVNTEKSMELRKLVRQFAQSNPEIAAQVIKTWLKGGDDGNG